MTRKLLSGISVAALGLVLANGAWAQDINGSTVADNGGIAVPVTDSLNGNTLSFSDTSTADSYNDNADNSVNDSYNAVTRYVSTSRQDLSGAVTNNTVRRPGSTGGISFNGGSFSGFGGINTAGMNTGLNSLNQAATSISANANVSFD